MAEQTSTDPAATEHLRAGPKITLDEIAVHLDAAAVWLRQLAVAAETPAVAVDLGKNLCDELDDMARRLEHFGQSVGELDTVVAERALLAPTLPDEAPWGARAIGIETTQRSHPAVIPTMWQVIALARWHRETRALAERPDPPERKRKPSPAARDGITYLDGIADVPGLDAWESPRAAERRARARAAAIQAQALQEECKNKDCNAVPGQPCRTRTGRAAMAFHRPRITAATKAVDGQNGDT